MVNLWLLTTAASCTVTASLRHGVTTVPRFSRRSLTIMASGDVQAYFQRSQFCVVGASQDQTKFGNKVLRCYVQHNYSVTPINKKTKEIEGLTCVLSLTDWVDLVCQRTREETPIHGDKEETTTATVTPASTLRPSDLGVSIVTPPGVTKGIVEEGYRLGIHHHFSSALTNKLNTQHPTLFP